MYHHNHQCASYFHDDKAFRRGASKSYEPLTLGSAIKSYANNGNFTSTGLSNVGYSHGLLSPFQTLSSGPLPTFNPIYQNRAAFPIQQHSSVLSTYISSSPQCTPVFSRSFLSSEDLDGTPLLSNLHFAQSPISILPNLTSSSYIASFEDLNTRLFQQPLPQVVTASQLLLHYQSLLCESDDPSHFNQPQQREAEPFAKEQPPKYPAGASTTSRTSPITSQRKKKVFYCTEPGCKSTFTASGSLKTHMLIHKGERPFECPTCGKTYTTANRLKVHVREHTNERPYKCEEPGCAYTAKQKCSLTSHALKHMDASTKEALQKAKTKTVLCQHCGRFYKSLASLGQHCWREHPEKHDIEDKSKLVQG